MWIQKVSVRVLKEIDVLIQHCLIGVNIKFLCVDIGSSCARLCQECFFVAKVTF